MSKEIEVYGNWCRVISDRAWIIFNAINRGDINTAKQLLKHVKEDVENMIEEFDKEVSDE